MKLFGHFSILYLVLAYSLSAGSFEEFKRTQNVSYSKFKDPRDNGFENYLKSQWQEYQAYITAPMYREEKPKKIVQLQEKKIAKVGPRVLIKLPEEKQKISQIPKSTKIIMHDIEIDFFTLKLGFTKDNEILTNRFYPHSQAGIANFFASLAKSHYELTLQEIKRYQMQLHLNGWAIYLITQKLAQKVYANEDDARIYQWFLLNKLGYDVKIALAGNDVYLLHASDTVLYQKPRYKFSGRYYYILTSYDKKAIQKIYTYKNNYPKAVKSIDFSLAKLPKLPQNRIEKKRFFQYEGRDYTIVYTQNKNLIEFMQSYPQVDYSIYFNASMDMQTYGEIATSIKKFCDGKKMADAMNFVLRFVQKAFIYKRDDQQFGHEKVMFADETLFYDASDCEDRAVLYAQLIKRLFGVSVVGVKYPDHMATALYIPMEGDSVYFAHKRYVIADPTYINANIGEMIKRYRSIQPERFIILKLK